MPLLRIKFVPNMNVWDEPQPAPERIAEKWFDDQPGENPSLYEAASHAEEVEAAAALSLTNLAKRIDVGYLVRIEWGDLASAAGRGEQSPRATRPLFPPPLFPPG